MDFEDLYNDEPRDLNKPSKLASEKKKREVSAQEALATTVSRVVLGLILFVSFAVGCWVAATALHHPDTCWFLALGRWIAERGAVPDLDPFSWTMTLEEANDHPFGVSQFVVNQFVVSQWLSALISYLSTLSGGLLTLLMLNAVVVVTAFLSLPIGFIVRRGAPFVAGLALVLLTLLTAFLCPLSCTEIFSYLFIAIFLQVVHHARSALLWHDEKIFRIAYVLVPLMLLWANLHVGFIIGLLILLGCLLGALLAKLFTRSPAANAVAASTVTDVVSSKVIHTVTSRPSSTLIIELVIALAGSLLASLATPYGFKVWAAIPALLASLFVENINDLNSGCAYWPYGLLCLTFVLLVMRESQACRGKQVVLVNALVISELVTATVVGGIAIVLSFAAPCLIVFTTLVVLAEVLTLLGLRRLAAHADASMAAASQSGLSESPRLRTFWQDLNYHSLDVWLAGGAFELAIVSFCSIAGVCLVANKVFKPELPIVRSVSSAFTLPSEVLSIVSRNPLDKSPIKALSYIELHKDELGVRLFNDAGFGNLIDWQLCATPKVFIDTRFHVYDEKIIDAYHTILDCLPGWQSLLDVYLVDWVFVSPNSKLGQALHSNSRWETRYQDDTAVILVRKKAEVH